MWPAKIINSSLPMVLTKEEETNFIAAHARVGYLVMTVLPMKLGNPKGDVVKLVDLHF